MKTSNLSWEAVCLAGLAMVTGLCLASSESASAAPVDEPEGRIVEIAPASNNDLPELREDELQDKSQSETAFWIGLRGRNVEEPVLRTQFQLAADMGVVIEQVMPESPAAKAGLRQHDILLRVNGEALQSMEQLAEVVRSSEGKPLELRLIRLSKEETIVVVPEERSLDLLADESNQGLFGFGGEQDLFGDLMQGRNNAFRIFPGAGFNFNGQWQTKNNLPGGYTVSITRNNNEPAKIVVKKGDETWTVEGDDEAALEELPEEVRARVKALMSNRMPDFNFGNLQDLEENLQFRMPRIFEEANQPGFDNEQRDKFLERMEKLERQLNDMRERLDEGSDPQ